MNQDELITIEEIKLFMPRLIHACQNVGDQLYEPITEQTWGNLGDVVEGIDDLYKTLNALQASMNEQATGFHPLLASIEITVTEINEKFTMMNTFMDEEEYANAGDIIRYELIPLFQQLKAELGESETAKDQRFDVNMLYLKRKYRQIYAHLENIVLNDRNYKITYAKNGLPSIVLLNKAIAPAYLHSRFEPLHEANRWVKLLVDKVRDKSKILIYGLGFGYLIQSYTKMYPDHKLYIYEPDEQIFLHMMRVIDLESLFRQWNVADIVVNPDEELKNHFLKNFSQQKGEPEMVVSSVYQKLYHADVLEFHQKAIKALQLYSNFLFNSKRYGYTWTRNSMYNLSSILSSPSIAGLKDKFQGVTAIIVGAGPSLEQDIEVLRKLKQHALIIAAGSSIQSLLHYNLEPHLIVSIDGGEPNFEVFRNLNIKSIPLLFAPIVEHRIIENKADQLIHTFISGDSTAAYFMQLTDEDMVFLTTYSVTGTAIQAAIYMGCTDIVFSGQDLSYPTDHMYASGAKHLPEKDMSDVIRKAELNVLNVCGTMNRTNQAMIQTLANIEELLERFPDIQFTNTSKLGAKIAYTNWQPIEEVLQNVQYKVVQQDILIREMQTLETYDPLRINKTCEMINRLDDQLPECERSLKQISRKIIKLSETDRFRTRQCQELISKIDNEWENITHSAPFKGLYLRLCMSEIKKFEVELPKLTAAGTIQEQICFYCETMKPLITTMIQRTPEIMEIVQGTKQRLATLNR